MITADVVVVGAGPAGSATAITLARAGCEVVVVDRAHFPRDKCCGDGLTASALRHLNHLGVAPNQLASWNAVETVTIRSPSGRRADLELPAAPTEPRAVPTARNTLGRSPSGLRAAVVRRAHLDAALVGRAVEAGARVLEGTAFGSLRPTPAGLELSLADGTAVQARFAVAADGMWSQLRRAASPARSRSPDRGEWHAFRLYLEGVDPLVAHAMLVWFEVDLIPGYAWSFPLPGGRTNFGFGAPTTGASAAALAKQVSDLLTRPHIRDLLGPKARPESGLRSWPIPARPGLAGLSAAGGRVLLVGDAARLADPLTGEGVAQALHSGILAGRALAWSLSHAAARPSSAARRYRRAVAAGLVADNFLAARLSAALAHPNVARASVAAAGLSPWTRRHFARWMMEDYPRAQVLTPWRWGPVPVRAELGGAPTRTRR